MSGDESHHLAETFAALARRLEAEGDRTGTYQRITYGATDLVDGCDHAAISLVRRHGPITTVAATSNVPALVDRIQYDTGEGPCLDAVHAPHSNLVDDLAAESRWPRFSSRAAAETGVRSMLTFQLYSRDDVLGALNLYSTTVKAFDERSRAIGAVLAAHAAIAMGAAHDHAQVAQLKDSQHGNRRIGMAIGILMSQQGITEERAFTLLVEASQHLNVKLRALAETVVETGEIPREPRRLS